MDMQIDKLKLSLIISLITLELERFKRNGIVPMAKHGRVNKNITDILTYIATRDNSIFTILTCNQTHGVYIQNISSINDHTKIYYMTISESLETYKVDELVYLDKPKLYSKLNYNNDKL